MSQDDKELWEAADANQDGILDKAEWIVFSHPEEHPVMLPIILKQALRDKDTDKDGAVDFQVFAKTILHTLSAYTTRHLRWAGQIFVQNRK